MFNAHPRITTVPILPGHECLVIDDALLDPDGWVAVASEQRGQFAAAPHNAYPGIELALPDAVAQRVADYFAVHARTRLGARRIVRHHSRLSLVTMSPDQLQPRQWICHRDRLDSSGLQTAACVLYLFRDEALGGTAFYRPRRPPAETARLVHDSGVLDGADFALRYGIAPGYLHGSNDWFEQVRTIPPRYNRLLFYDGGALFHCSAIPAPERLSADPSRGRLTLNGFFVCRPSVRYRSRDATTRSLSGAAVGGDKRPAGT